MKLGIIGAGNIAAKIAKTINMMNFAEIRGVELYAVASRDIEKARSFAEKFNIPNAFGSYEEMLSDPELDLAYIATPHSLHYEQGMLCIEHGKAALIEKPFTPNAALARKLFDKAKDKGILVTEAMWTRYQPMRRTIMEVLESGIVGKPYTLTANISHVISQNERLVNPALAGGALLDVGIYAITIAEMIFGRPDHITGTCVKGDSGVDMQDAITMTWDDGRMAVLNCGIQALSDQNCEIYCTNGYLVINNITNPMYITAYDMDRRDIDVIACPLKLTGYEYELKETSDVFHDGGLECPSLPHEETLHILEEMDDLRADWGIVYPFEE